MSGIDAYKIFRQLEERKKRENPYKFYDKDELIDEILKLEDKLQQKENIIKEVREYIENVETLAMVDKVNIFSISTLKNILYKGEDKQC